MRGLCPRAPRIYRFRARIDAARAARGRPVIPAPESVLESLPSVALSPAQVTAF